MTLFTKIIVMTVTLFWILITGGCTTISTSNEAVTDAGTPFYFSSTSTISSYISFGPSTVPLGYYYTGTYPHYYYGMRHYYPGIY